MLVAFCFPLSVYLIPHCNDNVEIQALERPIMSASAPFGVVCLFSIHDGFTALAVWLGSVSC